MPWQPYHSLYLVWDSFGILLCGFPALTNFSTIGRTWVELPSQFIDRIISFLFFSFSFIFSVLYAKALFSFLCCFELSILFFWFSLTIWRSCRRAVFSSVSCLQSSTFFFKFASRTLSWFLSAVFFSVSCFKIPNMSAVSSSTGV